MTRTNQERIRIKSDERRLQIIDVALTLFAHKGFANTRTREIAESAGVSEALVFQHFKSKDELFRTALRVLFHAHPVSGELKAHLKQVDDIQFFRELALHFIHHNRKDPRIIKLALYVSLESGGHFGELTRVDETGPSMLSLVSTYIQKRIDDGAFIAVNPDIASRLFVETIFMHIADQSLSITGPELPFTDDEVVDTLVSIFLNGLKKQ